MTTVKEHLEAIHKHLHAIAELTGETIDPVKPDNNLEGLWKTVGGAFVRVTTWNKVNEWWDAVIINEKDITQSLLRYDRNGDVLDNEIFWNLSIRKRGEEKGWPI